MLRPELLIRDTQEGVVGALFFRFFQRPAGPPCNWDSGHRSKYLLSTTKVLRHSVVHRLAHLVHSFHFEFGGKHVGARFWGRETAVKNGGFGAHF